MSNAVAVLAQYEACQYFMSDYVILSCQSVISVVTALFALSDLQYCIHLMSGLIKKGVWYYPGSELWIAAHYSICLVICIVCSSKLHPGNLNIRLFSQMRPPQRDLFSCIDHLWTHLKHFVPGRILAVGLVILSGIHLIGICTYMSACFYRLAFLSWGYSRGH